MTRSGFPSRRSRRPSKREPESDISDNCDLSDKLTSSKLAQRLNPKTADLADRLIKVGYLELRDGKQYITPKGKDAGGEFRMGQCGLLFLWKEGLKL